MSSILSKKVALAWIGFFSVGVPVVYFVKKYFERKITIIFHDEDDDYKDIHEALFFDHLSISCRSHFVKENDAKKSCNLPNCSFYNLSRILHYLNSAETSLDLCLYLVTVKDLCEAILKAHKRGVKVRVITDEDKANGSGSQILTMRLKGIPVRHRHKSTTLMHHKFAVIDKRVMMTGSLNWTMQAICGNWEDLLITSQPQLVQPYLARFDRAWKDLE